MSVRSSWTKPHFAANLNHRVDRLKRSNIFKEAIGYSYFVRGLPLEKNLEDVYVAFGLADLGIYAHAKRGNFSHRPMGVQMLLSGDIAFSLALEHLARFGSIELILKTIELTVSSLEAHAALSEDGYVISDKTYDKLAPMNGFLDFSVRFSAWQADSFGLRKCDSDPTEKETDLRLKAIARSFAVIRSCCQIMRIARSSLPCAKEALAAARACMDSEITQLRREARDRGSRALLRLSMRW